MSVVYELSLVAHEPFGSVQGVEHSLWTYSVSWTSSIVNLLPVDPGLRLGILFSSRIAIQDPATLPNVPALQGMQLERSSGSPFQRVSLDVSGGSEGPVYLSLVAPSVIDAFTAVQLARQRAMAGPWSLLPFATTQAGEPALQQLLTGPAATASVPASAPLLEHSARNLRKATIGSFLVQETLEERLAATGSRDGLLKMRFLRQLQLQPGEIGRIQATASSGASTLQALSPDAWKALASFEAGAGGVITAAIASVPLGALIALGEALVSQREATPAGDVSSAPDFRRLARHATQGLALGTIGRGVEPIGFMNLERLEMTPAGIVRGELVATIPLAPLEETAVIQKEWSVTSKEFTSIVTDSLENVSETGVTDNTELAQATSSQSQHSNQFNITGTVSGGVDHVFDASASTGFTAQDSSSATATASVKHSSSITQKASSRVKKEHKVTISTTTVTGSSETTTRSLKNPDPVNPMRIDYFRMMRQWRVRLYRYGLRLTYDLMIAEPAGQFRLAHAYLAHLQGQLGPFEFLVPHFPPGHVRKISDDNYTAILKLADDNGAQLPPFPEPPASITVVKQLSKSDIANAIVDDHTDPINVPEGYWIEHLMMNLRLRNHGKARILFCSLPEQEDDNADGGGVNRGPIDLTLFGLGYHQGGAFSVYVSSHDCENSFIEGTAVFSPTDATLDKWLADAWQALYNGAQAKYFVQQQDIAARVAQLQDRLFGVDTLTLRREESEEIMKLALATMPGDATSTFWRNEDVYAELANLSEKANGWPPLADPLRPFSPGPKVDPRPLGAAFTRVADAEVFWLLPLVDRNEMTVRFMNQAIEWENVVSFLYGYCWDEPQSWNFVRNLQHPDPTRQAFLRAGSARVVLTVRKGWEQMWTAFVHTGVPYSTSANDPSGNPIPFMSIAQEIAAYDDRNYPGIPPANTGRSNVRLQESVVTVSSSPVPGGGNVNVQLDVDSTDGLVVGSRLLIDSGVHLDLMHTSGWQESTTLLAISGRTITVGPLNYEHGAHGSRYAVVQPGESGVLMAEWNEYTPSSGTDIAVTSNLATIA
ncbi:hypothetical protein [Piscinibacter terrae]|uniref:Uncharacterized protein n=1 Tax=Piscinibacter terrae TaxID=2496871 RepID=A0A3N7HIJ6_9BURK|nr:hypothetical protein [Albitalea terrae]RQP21303.1 hypothetical protein DZC73_27775 [Albitalea terrae]